MKKCFAVLLSICVFSAGVFAESDLSEVAYRQALLDLGTDLRLMCVAAHPDDEDSGTLTVYRKRYGLHTIAVNATRGEGGQNEIGPELYEELAVIRTREMQAASDVTGADLRFLSLPEFGYSKSREETYAIWGEEEALRRMVRLIRETKPDVIITNHGPTGGHGHHQAIGHTLQRAFEVSGDPAVFPEQIAAGLDPWQPARLYLRGGGGVETDMTAFDEVRGMTYAQISAQALSKHLSQGFDKFVRSGFFGGRTPSYSLVKSHDGGVQNAGTIDAVDAALLEGLKDRVPLSDRALSQSDKDRDEILDEALALVKEARAARDESDAAWRRWERANRLAVVAAKLRLQGETSEQDEIVVPGQSFTVQSMLSNFGSLSGDAKIWVEFPGWSAEYRSEAKKSDSRAPQRLDMALIVPENASLTVPNAKYVYEDRFNRPQIEVVAEVDVGPTVLELRRPIYVDVAPPVHVAFVDPAYVVRDGQDRGVSLTLELTNYAPEGSTARVNLDSARGVSVDPAIVEISFKNEGEQRIVPVFAEASGTLQAGDYPVTASLGGSDAEVATAVRVVDLELPEDVRVGVIQSYDDTFMRTLDRLGVPHTALTRESFRPERLDEFTTIIVDIRAYLVRPDLVANNEALLEYVARGGNLIVMYHKTFEWESDFAPYPIRVSRNRVTVEDAPMEILAPAHRLFTTPNAIGSADWEDWRQERGLYFPSNWDDRYTPLIAVSDPGEDIPPGSCLIAEYGEGTYMYTSLVWYRQLREVHPGALRIFANMLAL